jgi:putative transposase
LSRYKVSQRARSDAMLLAEIRAPLAASRGIYGAPRIHAELAAKGIRVGRKRIPRLMSQAGVVGASRRKFVMTAKDGSRPAPDLVDRNFRVDQPNRLSPTSLTFRPGRAFSISPLCSMH